MGIKNIIDVIRPDKLAFMDTLSLNSGKFFYFEYNNEIYYSSTIYKIKNKKISEKPMHSTITKRLTFV